MFDQVLVALQLGRGIAAHALVMVGGDGGVEHVHREIQHAVLRVLVGLDDLVHRTLGEGFAEVLRGGEMVAVEVALAHYEKVHREQEADAGGGHPSAAQPGEGLRVIGLSLGRKAPHDEAHRCKNEQQGAQGIGPEKGDAILDQGLDQDILHPGIGLALEGAEEPRRQIAQQAESAGDGKCDDTLFPEGLQIVFPFDQAVQGQKAQNRQRHLQHHQRHRNRTELVIKGQVLETELCKGHEMAAHRHQYGQEGGRQQPPLFPPPV